MGLKENGTSQKDLKKLLHGLPLYSNKIYFEPTGERRWIIRKGMPWPKTLKDGMYPYCVLEDGEVRFSERPRPESNIHHPELVNNKDVLAAGMFRINDKKITYIDNQSGHYAPEADSINYAIMAMQHWGIPLENLQVNNTWEVYRRK